MSNLCHDCTVLGRCQFWRDQELLRSAGEKEVQIGDTTFIPLAPMGLLIPRQGSANLVIEERRQASQELLQEAKARGCRRI